MRKKSNQHFLSSYSFFIFPPLLLMIDYAFADSLCCHHFFSSSPALCWIHFNEHCWDLNSISSNLMSHLQRISPGFVSATFTLFTLHLRRARCSLQSFPIAIPLHSTDFRNFLSLSSERWWFQSSFFPIRLSLPSLEASTFVTFRIIWILINKAIAIGFGFSPD